MFPRPHSTQRIIAPKHRYVQPGLNHWTPWVDWASNIITHPPSNDQRTLLENAKSKPAREPHRLHQAEAVLLVNDSIKAFMEKADSSHSSPPHMKYSASDFPFLIFNEIDAVLFSGILKGNIYLKWAGQDLPPGILGRTFRAGRDSCPRITIELCRESFYNRPSAAGIVQTLIHQMIHAYLLQCCGHKNADVKGSGHDLKHGLEYSTIAYIIQRFVMVPGEVSHFPGYFGCSDARMLSRAHYRAPMRHGRMLLPVAPTAEAGGSVCRPSDRGGITKSAAEYWFDYVTENVVAPKLDLPNQNAKDGKEKQYPISQYAFVTTQFGTDSTPKLRSKLDLEERLLEIHFQNRAYLIARSNLANIPSLDDKSSSNSVLKVPGDDKSIWQKLLDFIMTKNYKPSIDKHQSDAPSSGKTHGPPRIVKYNADDDPFLLTDVKMYRLAMSIDLPELKSRAIQRLRDQAWTREDPCIVLEYIYHGGPAKKTSSSDSAKKSDSKDKDKQPETKPADAQIREFVREFLKVKSKESQYANNLEILQKHPDWAEKYKKLRERGSELITDIDMVETQLRKEKEEKKKRDEAAKELLYPRNFFNGPGYSELYPGSEHGSHTPPYPFVPPSHGYDPRKQPYNRRTRDDSDLPYAGHWPAPLGMSEETWAQLRLEHELQAHHLRGLEEVED